MNEFQEVAFVQKGTANIRVTERIIGVAAWSNALQCDRLKWENEPPAEVRNYRLFLVNLFPQSQHITHIKKLNPEAVVVAMPDPHLERMLRDGNLTMLEEMQKADYIGGRTNADCQVYGHLLNRPAVWMPSPIDIDALSHLRETPKEDFVLTVDHRCEPNLTAQNIAAVAAVQRELGLKVVYCKPQGNTLELARLAGLEAEFMTRIPFYAFVHLIARAKFGIDMYAGHANHRHGQAHAAIGTPLITSSWGNYTNAFSQDFDGPFDINGVLDVAHGWCEYDYLYENARNYAFETVDKLYSFESARRRVRELLSGETVDVRDISQSRRAYGLRFTS